VKLDFCETKNKDESKKRWIATPQKDAADGETKRLAQLTLFAGSLLIAKTIMAPVPHCFVYRAKRSNPEIFILTLPKGNL